MITIHHEITIDTGEMQHPITLWLVSYNATSHKATPKDWPVFMELLRRFSARRGWLVETGEDPYTEKSLTLFDGGFAWPPDDDEAEEEEEEEEDNWYDDLVG